MFINDLPDVIELLFADDAKIYAVVSNQADNNKVQSSLNRAVNWADIWKMLLYNIKCHHLHVGKHNRGTKYTIISNNQEIELEKVKNEKYLGAIIDQNFKTLRDHINFKVNIANRNLGNILRSFTIIDEEMFLNLFKTIVRPHIEYAIPIWSPLYKNDKIIIDNVQRRATN